MEAESGVRIQGPGGAVNRHRQGGFLIARIHQLGGRVFARKLRSHGIDINPAQGRILYVLWQGGRMPIQEVARRTSLGKSTLTSMLDRLEQSGYVRRAPSREDRRVIHIELTEENRKLHRLHERVSAEMTDEFYRGFSGREIDGFEANLRRVLDNLKAMEE